MKIQSDYIDYWHGRISSTFDEKSVTTIKNFDTYLEALDYSENTRESYLSVLYKLLDTLKISLENITKNHVIKFMGKLKQQDIKRSSRKTYYRMIRRFFKWYKKDVDMDIEFPRPTKEVKIKRDWENKLPTMEEIELMLKKNEYPRDRAFLAIVVESGARINEILRMTYGDIKVNDVYIRATLRGRTKQRDIPLIWAAKHIMLWLDCHPTQQDNDPLWPSQKTGAPITYKGAYTLIKRIARKAGIKKKIHPHLYRHLRSTIFAEDATISTEMKKLYLGHSLKSRTYEETYVHPGQEAVIDAVLQSKGLVSVEKDEKIKAIFKTELCPRCNSPVAKDDKYCSKCWFILDQEEALNYDEEREKNKLIQLKIINLLQGLLTDKNEELSELLKLVNLQ